MGPGARQAGLRVILRPDGSGSALIAAIAAPTWGNHVATACARPMHPRQVMGRRILLLCGLLSSAVYVGADL
ncbi:MAG TPA: hypothetical protein VL172_09070, partial [Kofleriaceae bacterium]|nr:hypothetical protein [Kofleriaceae bacterium]